MWSAEDLTWLKDNYPSLNPVAPDTLEGRVSFRMLHKGDQNYINPNRALVTTGIAEGGVYICDTYRVRIVWRKHGSYPNAYEIGGRIEKTAARTGKNMMDMHTYSSNNNALCVANPMDLLLSFTDRFDLKQYIEGYLIPYLFEQTHHAKTGDWLWGELSHGHWGHLEWLGRRLDATAQDILGTALMIVGAIGPERAEKLFSARSRDHHPCPCGMDKRTRNCHPDIKDAINQIRGELSRRAFTIIELAEKASS